MRAISTVLVLGAVLLSVASAATLPVDETTVPAVTENTDVIIEAETEVPAAVLKESTTSSGTPINETAEAITDEAKALEALKTVSENVVETDDQVVDDFETWEAPLEIRKNYPYYLSGFDDENRPIWIAEFGRYNIRKMVEEGGQKLQDFDKYAQQAAYRILKSVKLRSTPEEPVTHANFIVDFDDFKLSTVAHVPTLSYIVHLAKLYRDLIEKHIHVGIGVNANFVAERLIGLTRPVFGAIMEKIEIYGTNRARWISQLRKSFPMDQLPEWYGGPKGYQPLRVYG